MPNHKKIAVKINKREAKALREYHREKHPQLDLFSEVLPSNDYTNTIELYDFVPKYVASVGEYIEGKFLDSKVNPFVHRGKSYTVRIDPARLVTADGQTRDHFPTHREELVEDALRKMACEGALEFFDEVAGLTFSLYALQQELRLQGHTFSLTEIKEALQICAATMLHITSEDGSVSLTSTMFETLGLASRGEENKGRKSEQAFVRFNILVTKAIKEGKFRPVEYRKLMSYKRSIARQLHKRMSHFYIQASQAIPYTINLSTIIRDLGLRRYPQLLDNFRELIKALDEMQELRVLREYEFEKIVEGRRKKFIDAKFILYPHQQFVSTVIGVNKQLKDMKV